VSFRERSARNLSQLPEVYTHTRRTLRGQIILEFGERIIFSCQSTSIFEGSASRSVSPWSRSSKAIRSFDRLASERVRDELARGRRSSQHDAEMETVRPVRFASLFVLHVLSTFLFSCVYVFTVTKEKKPRVIAVVSSSIIV